MKCSRVPVRSFARGWGDGFFGKSTLARKEPRFFETELEACDAVIEDEGDKSF